MNYAGMPRALNRPISTTGRTFELRMAENVHSLVATYY
jgi:hypothetical protein